MCGVIAFSLRVKLRRQSKVSLPGGMKRAKDRIFKLIQLKVFPDVFEGKQTFCKKSKVGLLATFSPFLDDTGLIRVRGRSKDKNLSFKQRQPILLSTKHEYGNVLSRDLHLQHNHVDYVRSVIQQKIWIL